MVLGVVHVGCVDPSSVGTPVTYVLAVRMYSRLLLMASGSRAPWTVPAVGGLRLCVLYCGCGCGGGRGTLGPRLFGE